MTTTPPLVRLEQEGNVLVVSPLFTCTAICEAELHAQWAVLERMLRNPAIEHVTIDLGEIPFFGSLLLEWMVLIWKRIRARGGRMVICRCSEIGLQALTAARFDTVWQICDDRAGAMATFV